MNVYALNSQAAAQACQAAVDAHLGLPIAGRDVGGGIHAPPSQSATTTYAAPLQNASNPAQWGYLADATTTPVLAPQAVALGLAAPVAVDASWYPPSVFSGATGATGATGGTVGTGATGATGATVGAQGSL